MEVSMLRKIGFTLICAVATFSSSTYAMVSHTLQPGMTVEYELVPNEPQLFINYMFWAIEANCKIATVDESDNLFAEALAKKGKINDITLSEGQSMWVTVHPGENLKLSADSGAKVKITNTGLHTVKATCVA